MSPPSDYTPFPDNSAWYTIQNAAGGKFLSSQLENSTWHQTGLILSKSTTGTLWQLAGTTVEGAHNETTPPFFLIRPKAYGADFNGKAWCMNAGVCIDGDGFQDGICYGLPVLTEASPMSLNWHIESAESDNTIRMFANVGGEAAYITLTDDQNHVQLAPDSGIAGDMSDQWILSSASSINGQQWQTLPTAVSLMNAVGSTVAPSVATDINVSTTSTPSATSTSGTAAGAKPMGNAASRRTHTEGWGYTRIVGFLLLFSFATVG